MKNYWRAGCGESRTSGSEGACWKSTDNGNSLAGYPTYQALRSHDPMLIAIPMALFVDLLHFRTVQRAVQTRKTLWQLTAVFTTALAFGLQWMFYSQPGEEGTLIWWQTILFASIVPVGLAIMAWHHEQGEEEQVVDWQAAIAEAERQAAKMQAEAEVERGRATEMQARADEMQAEAEAERRRAEKMQRQAEDEQARATQMQTRAEVEQQRADEMQARAEREQSRATQMQARAEAEQVEAEAERSRAEEMQTQRSQMQAEATAVQQEAAQMQTRAAALQTEADRERERADAMQVQLTAVQAEAEQMQAELTAMQTQAQQMQPMGKAWAGMNAEMQVLAFFNVDLLSAKEAATQLAVHETTVRRRAKALNGVKGVN